MDPKTFMDIATVVTKLKMYPYFDIAHYVLMCCSVREDMPQVTGPQAFSRKHPLSCWFSCMLICFAGSFIANLLLGEPCLTPFKDHKSLITATVVWYLIFYSPFDIVYKIVKFLPFKIVLAMLKETQRAHKVYHGVIHTAKLYPNAYVIIVMIGTIKGAGSGMMKNVDRLVRGIWVPTTNELLQPTFYTKASAVASLVFLLERQGLISVPHPLVYFGVVIFFIYFKLSSIILGIHDPFGPFENLFCAIFMGGIWDAMRRAVTKEPKKEEESKDMRNDVIKSKEDKKRD
ncbi:trimeric intracellular cation channel type 1B.1-like [Haliotis asinina]|uniref:trimeric intracellular cation channel type 1B.1-like n=1 Tax=Haliotis asinina TaxID=109174 RepID=UPI0035318401